MTIFQIKPWVSFSQIESVRSLIIYFLLKNSWHNSNWKLCSSSINYHWFSCDNNGCPTRFDFTEMKSIQLAIQAQIILLIGLKYFRNSSSHFFIGDRKWEISSKVEINRFGSHCWEFMTTRFQLEFVFCSETSDLQLLKESVHDIRAQANDKLHFPRISTHGKKKFA